jgi:transposase
MAYSANYRKAAIEYKRNGHTFKDLKEVFRITPRTYYQWVKILEKTGMTKLKKRNKQANCTGTWTFLAWRESRGYQTRQKVSTDKYRSGENQR